MCAWFSKFAKPRVEKNSTPPPLSKEDFKGLQRTLRKLNTGIEEHVEALSCFDDRIKEVKGISTLQESAYLSVIDRLYQLHEALKAEHHRLAGELFAEVVEIERLARLSPTAQYDHPIDPTECQAVATVDVEESGHGMVQSIVRQGYRRPNESLVREAVVILGRKNNAFRDKAKKEVDSKEVSNG
jgi:hypothetical protein